MAVFSTDQVRNLYVVEAYNPVTPVAPIGTMQVISTTEGGDATRGDLYFKYVGAGGPTRSDIIPKGSITYAKAISKESLARGLEKYIVSLDASVSATPIPGQIYVLGITIRDFGSLSPEDTYYKNAAVSATTGMTAAQFYTAMAAQLNLSWSRESIKYFNFSATPTGIIIEEVEQPWTLGLMESAPLNFVIKTDVITTVDGFELGWGTVTKQTPTTIVQNGKVTADLEYFTLGERGDIYRNVGFPYVLKSTYLVNPTLAYDYIEIDFSYSGDCEDIQHSKKHITLVSASRAATNSLIAAINSQYGGRADILESLPSLP